MRSPRVAPRTMRPSYRAVQRPASGRRSAPPCRTELGRPGGDHGLSVEGCPADLSRLAPHVPIVEAEAVERCRLRRELRGALSVTRVAQRYGRQIENPGILLVGRLEFVSGRGAVLLRQRNQTGKLVLLLHLEPHVLDGDLPGVLRRLRPGRRKVVLPDGDAPLLEDVV